MSCICHLFHTIISIIAMSPKCHSNSDTIIATSATFLCPKVPQQQKRILQISQMWWTRERFLAFVHGMWLEKMRGRKTGRLLSM